MAAHSCISGVMARHLLGWLLLAGSAGVSAGLVQTTITGRVSAVPFPQASPDVHVGDSFGFVVRFDDALGVHSQVTVGGTLYSVTDYSFSTGMDGWYGSLVDLIRGGSLAPTSLVTKRDWFRPPGTLHHEDWSMFSMDLVTNYMASSGESYGWYKNGPISLTIDSAVTTPVPEPQSYLLALTAMGFLFVVMRRRTRSESQ